MATGTLSERMKDYENISRFYLTKKSPVVIRIDGKAFHSFTKGFDRPFDLLFMEAMAATAKYLCENISDCKLAYLQSDEISLLITDYDTPRSQAWFDYNLQKLVSISASMATLAFNREFERLTSGLENPVYRAAVKKGGTFDSRAFVLPKEEVCNYFIWRQQDATRNSILMVAQSRFTQKELQGIKCDLLQDKLFLEANINWNDFPIPQKRGSCVVKKPFERNGALRHKWVVDEEIPIFTKDNSYINDLVYGRTEL